MDTNSSKTAWQIASEQYMATRTPEEHEAALTALIVADTACGGCDRE